MIIDWQASKEDWIARIVSDLMPRLRADARFLGSQDMARRFQAGVERWRKNGDFRPVINDGNELCAAEAILTRLGAGDRLHYEPKLSATRKSIDFLAETSDAARSWFDMKTVAPGWQDDDLAWERLKKIAEDFPANATLVVDREFAGAAIGGQFLKARWSFVQRAAELEVKIALLVDQERAPVRLVLCSEGAWHEDDLEDFADFYRTGAFRADDWAQNAVARYMKDEGIAFAGTIAGFCYLERRHDEIEARRFTVDVHGPAMFAPPSHR
jgi:hypothetical protein